MINVVFIILGILLFCMLAGFFMVGCINGFLGKRLQLSLGHNYKYKKEYDKLAQDTFEKYKQRLIEIDEIDCYSIKFSNGVVFWIANKYYGYGQAHEINGVDVTQEHRMSVKNALVLESIENGTFERGVKL